MCTASKIYIMSTYLLLDINLLATYISTLYMPFLNEIFDYLLLSCPEGTHFHPLMSFFDFIQPQLLY